jgi:hypothetical protein
MVPVRLHHVHNFLASNIVKNKNSSKLENYYCDACSEDEFSELEGIDYLYIKLVDTRKNIVCSLVYLLLELSLILHVTIATAKRALSIIKNRL